MRDLFSEYGLVALDIIVGIIAIVMFFKVFWGNDSLVGEVFSIFIETLM